MEHLSAPQMYIPCTWLESLPPLRGAGPTTFVNKKSEQKARVATNEWQVLWGSSVVAAINRGPGKLVASSAIPVLLQARYKHRKSPKHHIRVKKVVQQRQRELRAFELSEAGLMFKLTLHHAVPRLPKQQQNITSLPPPNPESPWKIQSDCKEEKPYDFGPT